MGKGLRTQKRDAKVPGPGAYKKLPTDVSTLYYSTNSYLYSSLLMLLIKGSKKRPTRRTRLKLNQTRRLLRKSRMTGTLVLDSIIPLLTSLPRSILLDKDPLRTTWRWEEALLISTSLSTITLVLVHILPLKKDSKLRVRMLTTRLTGVELDTSSLTFKRIIPVQVVITMITNSCLDLSMKCLDPNSPCLLLMILTS